MTPPAGSSRVRLAYRLRPATTADLPALVAHRSSMWREIRRYPEADLAAHEPEYRRWIRPRLQNGEVVAWIAEGRAGVIAASGALWFQPTLPRPGMPQLSCPYVFTMYTEPAHRGNRLATRIVEEMIRVSRKRKDPRVLLHASRQGRSVYRRMGFERTWEMRFWIDERQAHVPRAQRPRAHRRGPAGPQRDHEKPTLKARPGQRPAPS